MPIFLQMYLGPPGLEVTSLGNPATRRRRQGGASVAELPSADPKVGTPVQSTSPLGPSLGPPPGLHAPFFLCPWVSAPSGHCARVCTLACKSGQQAVCTLRSAALRTRLGSAGQLLAQLSDPESQEGCPPGGASTPRPALSSRARHPSDHPASAQGHTGWALPRGPC